VDSAPTNSSRWVSKALFNSDEKPYLFVQLLQNGFMVSVFHLHFCLHVLVVNTNSLICSSFAAFVVLWLYFIIMFASQRKTTAAEWPTQISGEILG